MPSASVRVSIVVSLVSAFACASPPPPEPAVVAQALKVAAPVAVEPTAPAEPVKAVEPAPTTAAPEQPRIEIAGVVLDRAPVPGSPALVTVFPASGSTLAPDQAISVVWDQPVEPGDVERAIFLLTDDIPRAQQGPFAGKSEQILAKTVSNPKTGALAGHTLDPRQIVEVRPKRPRPGKGVELGFSDETLEGEERAWYYRYSR